MLPSPYQLPVRRDGIRPGALVSGIVGLAAVNIFFVLFLFSLFASASSSAPSTRGWAEVPCRIESSSVERRRVDDFAFTAEYSYYWNGLMHRAAALDRPGGTHHTFQRLETRIPLLEKYARGTDHVCLVDPENDDNAVLPVGDPFGGRANRSWGLGLLLPAFFLIAELMGALGLVEAFPKTRRLWGGRLRRGILPLCMTLFGSLFAMEGAGMLSDALSADHPSGRDLVPVTGKVLYTGVASHPGGGGSGHSRTLYSARIGYEYDYRGKTYESDRVDGLAGEYASSGSARARRLAQSVRPGSTVKVWVLPSDPRRSTLHRSGGPDLDLLGFPLFLSIGLVIAGAGIFLLVRALRPGQGTETGRWPLRRSRGNTLSFGAFALFWNLLAWPTAIVFMSAPGPHDPMMRLVWAFPLIGAAVAAAFAVALRRDLHAPKLAMTLSRSGGTTPTLDWSLDAPSAFHSLSIQLEGLAPAGRKQCLVVSIPVCKHAAPVPGTRRETVHIPPPFGEDERWRLAATLEPASSPGRPIRLEYPIPDEALPLL